MIEVKFVIVFQKWKIYFIEIKPVHIKEKRCIRAISKLFTWTKVIHKRRNCKKSFIQYW